MVLELIFKLLKFNSLKFKLLIKVIIVFIQYLSYLIKIGDKFNLILLSLQFISILFLLFNTFILLFLLISFSMLIFSKIMLK